MPWIYIFLNPATFLSKAIVLPINWYGYHHHHLVPTFIVEQQKKTAKNGSKLSLRKNWRSVTLHSFNTISCVPQTWCIDFTFVRTVPLFFNTFRISWAINTEVNYDVWSLNIAFVVVFLFFILLFFINSIWFLVWILWPSVGWNGFQFPINNRIIFFSNSEKLFPDWSWGHDHKSIRVIFVYWSFLTFPLDNILPLRIILSEGIILNNLS